ncbi:hypothetical protein [Oerskovia paurometabola]|uniref:hypothetical protein n=1 Tax=Oerskovia paurometabola TaxID=162170 RepID=UPI00195D633F|nr:hypothetical protein [Oerskovia paurometabola]MBM7497430.1 hypothetical protein [Oerskovia paurometabola]
MSDERSSSISCSISDDVSTRSPYGSTFASIGRPLAAHRRTSSPSSSQAAA